MRVRAATKFQIACNGGMGGYGGRSAVRVRQSGSWKMTSSCSSSRALERPTATGHDAGGLPAYVQPGGIEREVYFICPRFGPFMNSTIFSDLLNPPPSVCQIFVRCVFANFGYFVTPSPRF